jgi:hypothetical protein
VQFNNAGALGGSILFNFTPNVVDVLPGKSGPQLRVGPVESDMDSQVSGYTGGQYVFASKVNDPVGIEFQADGYVAGLFSAGIVTAANTGSAGVEADVFAAANSDIVQGLAVYLSAVRNAQSATLTGVYVASPSIEAGSTASSTYGLYVDDQTGGTNNYAIRTGLGKVQFGDIVQVLAGTFSSLPTCNSGAEGTEKPVTDSTTNTWGATITGGGSNHVKAYCDGTNWTVIGK